MEILNVSKIAERIKKAIDEKERIILYGDADLDGVTSVLIMKEAIASMGGEVTESAFQDRLNDGYGLNVTAIGKLEKHAPALIVMMDVGITNNEEIPIANEKGFEVLIIDHHKVVDKLPAASIIVDPKQPGDPFPFKEYAACGLTWKVAEAMLGDTISPSMRNSLLELAALGTIADMMPREAENLHIIEEGIEAFENSWRPGIRAFLELQEFQDIVSIDQKIYQIISVLNVRDVENGLPGAYRILTAQEQVDAMEMVKDFMEQNRVRKEKIRDLAEKVRVRIAKENVPIVFQGGEDFEYILIPSVSSIISNETDKPTFIYNQGESESIGSVRAPSGYDTVDAMAPSKDFLVAFGGHPQASGFRVKNEDIEKLRTNLIEYFSK